MLRLSFDPMGAALLAGAAALALPCALVAAALVLPRALAFLPSIRRHDAHALEPATARSGTPVALVPATEKPNFPRK